MKLKLPWMTRKEYVKKTIDMLEALKSDIQLLYVSKRDNEKLASSLAKEIEVKTGFNKTDLAYGGSLVTRLNNLENEQREAVHTITNILNNVTRAFDILEKRIKNLEDARSIRG